MLDFLKKSAPAAVEAPPETVESVTAELHACEDELRGAGTAIQEYTQSQPDLRTFYIGDVTARLDLFKKHPELRRLESERSRILQRRNEILHRYAVLKMQQLA